MFSEPKLKVKKFRNVDSEVDFYRGKKENPGEGKESRGVR
jgi:hypothetical protein